MTNRLAYFANWLGRGVCVKQAQKMLGSTGRGNLQKTFGDLPASRKMLMVERWWRIHLDDFRAASASVRAGLRHLG